MSHVNVQEVCINVDWLIKDMLPNMDLPPPPSKKTSGSARRGLRIFPNPAILKALQLSVF